MSDPFEDFKRWAEEGKRSLESFLDEHLPAPATTPGPLHRAMRHACLGGGKRIRPLLTLASGELVHAPRDALIRVAASVELIHAYSLVHDDLPALDNDVLRRGKPSCHVAFGEATALLAGDALQSLAFQWLAETPLHPDPQRQLGMVRLLAQASGSRGMAGGQAIDLQSDQDSIGLPELEAMHLKKTGALIRAAVLMGALCGNEAMDEARQKHLTHFANLLGLVFQVVDDILDAESDSDTLGKTAGKDASARKATYVSLLGLPQSRDFAQELAQRARESLTAIDGPGARLGALTALVIERRF